MTDEVPRQRAFLSKIFPERRVYIRTDERTRYFSISPAGQLSLCVIAAGFAGWSAFATVGILDRAMDGSAAEARVAAAEEAYRARIDALYAERDGLEAALASALARGDAITERLAEKQGVLLGAEERLREFEAELGALRAQLDVTRTELEDEIRTRSLAEAELTKLELALAERETAADGLDETLGTVTAAFAEVVAARDAAVAKSGALATRVATLETDIAKWETRQERVLAQLEDAAALSLASLDKVFERSEIDLDAILESTRRDYSGTGGPEEPIITEPVIDGAASPDGSEVRVAALMSDLERVNLMRIAVERLPYGMPVTASVRFTSPFGPRRDPYRRSSRMHNGIDLAGPKGTPIFATAEGVVTFSGRQRGYGNLVKIRHAFGFETVYAHLNATHVEVGETVVRGDRIGDMGNTGRSTGSHLHYEVRIDGEPVNPMKFIEAARDVL